ncbi:sialidase family protein [Geobacter grbiciae]|uniref:sialidase family protein n=1 Tax=Geobacter grbiciae TaxID=155042 RepID=UPI001C03301A|nr:sialidase family protein [Geobacter grbiciae]
MSNTQVTHSSNPNNARSESSVVINPNNPLQIVAGSKKFKDIHNYDFTLATAYSADGGLSWHDSADLPMPGFTLLTDPALAWDDVGNVFLVGLSGTNPPTFDTIGIEIYKSTDGGKTWSNPNRIHTSTGDDKQWAAGDANPASPFHGRVYAVWDDGVMRFARTRDHGVTWEGAGAGTQPGSVLVSNSFSPEINVAANGNIYIVWLSGTEVKMIVSTDGGDSFNATVSPATGITPLGSPLPFHINWFHFPGGSFRVITVPSACVFGQTVAVAWADLREGISRIYYALSNDGGSSWTTGLSGQPLLTGALPANFQHFHPQITIDPNGVVGCAFYEFGPKPSTFLIDVIMAQSLDGGASFDHFTVTDQPWDPSVDAPWSHYENSPPTPPDGVITFIGEYFGLDSSGQGFYPVWTDTRTGIQELWTAIVPEKKCAIILNRNPIGQDEVDARRKQPHGSPGGLPIQGAFRVVVDGFTAAELGLSGSGSTLASLPSISPATGITISPSSPIANTPDNGDYGTEVQRFTFYYDIDFGATDAAFGFSAQTEDLTLSVTVDDIPPASALLTLIKQPDPFLLHGDPSWLSIDLRVFVVRQGVSMFGVPGITGPADAPRFIQQLMATITPAQFDSLPPDEDHSKLYTQPKDEHQVPVFNFALAKVHYIGLIGAANVRVFFRLFQAQSTTSVYDYPPGAQYRRATSNPHGQPIPLAGIIGNEYVTIPCFAAPRIDTTLNGMDQQTDDPYNVQTITAHADGSEVDAIFGCWLDINQPFKPDGVTHNNVFPSQVPPKQDGPFDPNDSNPAFRPLPIQQAILRNLHQCLIAELAFDLTPIPIGKDSSNWDKLAQRNISWSDAGSAQAVTTFEIRPTPMGLPVGQTPDELMIDWGNTPQGRTASIYLPAVGADTVLAMADRMYTSHRLTRADAHTLHCKTGGITYVPIPPGGTVNYAGLLSVDLPDHLPRGDVYTVAVQQVTNAFGTVAPPPPQIKARRKATAAVAAAPAEIEWRRILGAFQLTIPVHTKQSLLLREERDLSVLRWIGEAIPATSRWYPVFLRYLEQIGGRVISFGGDPGQILPSPTGDGRRKHHHHEEPEHEALRAFTGKIAGLIFDRFGDFEGFLLDTEDGERKFCSREKDVEELAERAWRERLRITVWAERHEPHRPLSIIIRQPPAPFGR